MVKRRNTEMQLWNQLPAQSSNDSESYYKKFRDCLFCLSYRNSINEWLKITVPCTNSALDACTQYQRNHLDYTWCWECAWILHAFFFKKKQTGPWFRLEDHVGKEKLIIYSTSAFLTWSGLLRSYCLCHCGNCAGTLHMLLVYLLHEANSSSVGHFRLGKWHKEKGLTASLHTHTSPS